MSIELFKTLQCETSLKSYIKQAWDIVEKNRKLIWNWHLDVICNHLEVVTNTFIVKSQLPRKQYRHDLTLPFINYLWINIPPRHTKSLIVSVFWPTWEWGPMNLPQLSYLFTSYAQGLSTRDSVKRRAIMESQWYQDRWGDRFQLTSDQNQKTRYVNDATGHMISTSIRGLGTGEGGDRVIIDDAHNVNEVESDTKRMEVLNVWDDSMGSRLNDEDTGAYIGIMHRTHHKDLTGHMLEKVKLGEVKNFVHICLPARYESDHPTPTVTPLAFKDPRTKEGEVLDKNRWPEEKLLRRENRMTKWAVAGQHQQRPTPRGGDLIQTEMIQVVDSYNERQVAKVCRYWDKAVTEDKSASKTASVKLAFMTPDCPYGVLIMDCITGRWSSAKREAVIRQTADLDGQDVVIGIEQEPGSGGKESAQNTARKTLIGYRVFLDRPSGAKEVRLEAFSAQVENGNVAILNRPWTRDYLDALEMCKVGSVTDEGDATSGAFNYNAGLTGNSRAKVRVHVLEGGKKEEPVRDELDYTNTRPKARVA